MKERTIRPTANIERDESLRAYEVCIESEDERHDLFKILYFDDGRTELHRWTYEEWASELSEAIVESLKERFNGQT